MSDDGKLVLGTDVGENAGPNFRFYVQRTDGSPALWLGEGDGQALSPDGRFALAVLAHAQPQQLVIVPTGAGETRTLEPAGVAQYKRATWDPSGRRVVFWGVDQQDAWRVYVQDVAGGPPRAVTAEGVRLGASGRMRPWSPLNRPVPSAILAQPRMLVTPDGESYAYNYARSLSDLYLMSNLK